jgi:hypothetical protein
MSSSKISWLSGFFEGEGSTGLFSHRRGVEEKSRWRIKTYLLFTNTDPLLINECWKICKELGVNMHISTMKRPEGKNWRLGYHLVCQNMKDTHILLKAMLPYMIGIKKAITEMTMRFIESRNYGYPQKGPGTGYTEADWQLCEKVKGLNQRGEKIIDLESSEAIRQALSDIEKIISGDDMVQTSMKVGGSIEM